MENVRDQDFYNTIRIDSNATDFLEQLNGSDKKAAKSKRKELDLWKKRAQKGTKEFFTSQQQYLFENEQAFARFQQRLDEGKNPIDPSDKEAAPASPVKLVENKTVKEEKIPEKKDDEKNAEEDNDEGDDEI